MSGIIVLDSSLLIAAQNIRDAHHEAAESAYGRIAAGEWGLPLLPEYIYLETVTVLASRCGLDVACERARTLIEAQEAEFIHCSPYFARAVDLFRTQRQTKMSLADCAVVAIARDRGAAHVGTFDDDFRKIDGLSVVPS